MIAKPIKSKKLIKQLFLFLSAISVIFLMIPQQNLYSQVPSFTLTAVGDMMLGTTYPKPILPPENGKTLFKDIQSYYKNIDIVFGNLEGTFTLVEKSPKDVTQKNTYAFRMPLGYINYLKEAGFNLLNVANNHSFDFGEKGYKDTIKYLKDNDFNVTGEKGVLTVMEVKGIKVGILGYSWYAAHNSILDIPASEKLIAESKAKVDVLIVTFHGGAEGETANHVKDKMEYFYNNQRGNVYQFAHHAIDAGADVVIGHGPHVLRGMEKYKGKLIAYSLGNFCTYGMFSMKWPRNISGILKLELTKQGDLTEGSFIPAILLYHGIPYNDPDKNAFSIMNSLSKEDFNDQAVLIKDDGTLKF